MMSLYLPISALVAGMIGLIWGADKFIAGSASLARSAGISSLVVGLTVVSIGTSAPEIIVSINAALKGSSELAVGQCTGFKYSQYWLGAWHHSFNRSNSNSKSTA